MTSRPIPRLAGPRVFHGWWIVLVGFISDFALGSVGTFAFSVFIIPMQDDLSWNRSALVGAVTLRTVVTALLGPLVGPLVDKKNGARLLVPLGALLGGLGFILMAQVEALWHFYMIFGVFGALSMMASGGFVLTTLVSKWFVRKRGRAIATIVMGNSTGGFALAPLANWLIDTQGWRTAWVVLGLSTWILIIPVSIILVRRRPEDMGLLPDGEPAREPSQGMPARPAEEYPWTVKEALRTKALWLVMAAYNIAFIGSVAFVLHLIPYLRDDVGLNAGAATAIFTTLLAATIPGRFIWGYLTERFPMRYVSVVGLTGTALSLLGMIFARSIEWLFPLAFIYGLIAAGNVVVQSIIWANYFGREFIGSIRGVLMPFSLVSSAGGPLIAAAFFDITGDYRLIFSLFFVFWLIAASLMTMAKPPTPPSVAELPLTPRARRGTR